MFTEDFLDEVEDFSNAKSQRDIGPLVNKSCRKCAGVGVIVKKGVGTIDASKCSCVGECGGDEEHWKELKKIEENVEYLNSSNIPPRFANAKFKGSKTFEDVAPQKLKDWFDHICVSDAGEAENCFIFLCGNIGNGKTHLSSECAKRFILLTGRSAKFLHADELIESKKDSTVFADRQNPSYKKDLEFKRRVVRYASLVVMDEIGQKKITDFGKEAFEEFVDLRYQSGLPTIFISNHTFRKETSLDGKTIEQIVGRRVADRLKEAVVVELTEESKRGLKDEFATSSVAKKDCEEFMLPLVKKGQTSVMHWVVRNSVFRVVSDQERNRLTFIDSDGHPQERSREQPEVFKDVWHKGKLVVNGPVCDFNDHDVFLALTEILHDIHRNGGNGIILVTSAREILSRLGKDPNSGANEKWLRRSLKRLSGMNINYSDEKGNTWGGGIISNYLYEGETKGQRIIVTFNPYAVPVYRSGWYSRYKLSDSRRFSQLAKGILAFIGTHQDDSLGIGVEKWRQILGQTGTEFRLFKFRFKKAINELIEEDIFSENSNIDHQNIVHTLRNSDYRSNFLQAANG